MRDFFRWRERPWTLWVIAALGLVGNIASVMADASVWNVVLAVIALALLAGLWHGNPTVRLFYAIVLFVAVVLNVIGLANEPGAYWSGFAVSVGMLTLLLAPPTHRWAQQREERRQRARARA